MQPGDLVGLRERLHDAIRRDFARRPLRLQLIAADQPAVGAGGFVEKQRHGLQLWHSRLELRVAGAAIVLQFFGVAQPAPAN